MQHNSHYLDTIYNIEKYKKSIKLVTKKVKELKKEYCFDSIAFRGSSGAAYAYPLSVSLSLNLMHVRTSRGHFNGSFEGVIGSKSYIFIDDFMETGNTFKKTIESISKYTSSELVGIIMYNQCSEDFCLSKVSQDFIDKCNKSVKFVQFLESESGCDFDEKKKMLEKRVKFRR